MKIFLISSMLGHVKAAVWKGLQKIGEMNVGAQPKMNFSVEVVAYDIGYKTNVIPIRIIFPEIQQTVEGGHYSGMAVGAKPAPSSWSGSGDHFVLRVPGLEQAPARIDSVHGAFHHRSSISPASYLQSSQTAASTNDDVQSRSQLL